MSLETDLESAILTITQATEVANRTTLFIQQVAFGDENTTVPDPEGGSNSSPTIRKLIKDEVAGALSETMNDLIQQVNTLRQDVIDLNARIDNL
ncbi:coil containing protein [Vibrio phage 1.244.A._10N.261.54.C3]|nr:coil containing protein [Vibrio phage 1.244.A._10N.261.54.C3]AUR98831.1 coil containing protein [Vibrio phage 1.255.O._10N.286.45.F1]